MKVIEGKFNKSKEDTSEKVFYEILDVFEKNGDGITMIQAIGVLELIKQHILDMNAYEE